MELAKQDDCEVIIMSNTNAKSVLCNEDETNPRGHIWEEFISNNNLIVTNEGNNITFFRHNAASIIDVAMATPKVANNISHFRTINYAPSSDHVPYIMALKLHSGKLRWL